jgi:protein involved in polysaccharide export with SLBB domain
MSIRIRWVSLICAMLIGCASRTGHLAGRAPRSDHSLVAPGDLLLVVTDFDIPNHTADEHLLRVDQDGMICLWMVNRIPVAGRSVADLRGYIAQRFRDEGVEGRVYPEVWRVETASDAAVTLNRISPGDNLLINLWGLEDPTGKTTDYRYVDKRGIVKLTVIGDVKLLGLTESEAVLAIRDAARSRGIAQDMQSTVRRIPEWAVSSVNAR